MIVSKGWFSCLGTTTGGRAFVVQSPLFLLVSAKNTGHSQSRKSMNHGLSAPLRILRNSKQ